VEQLYSMARVFSAFDYMTYFFYSWWPINRNVCILLQQKLLIWMNLITSHFKVMSLPHCKTWGFLSDGNSYHGLGCDTMWWCDRISKFWSTMLPLSSEYFILKMEAT